MNVKITRSFQKLITGLTLFCFLIIWGGTFFAASSSFFTEFLPLAGRIALLALAAGLLLAALLSIFKRLEGCSQKMLLICSGILFAVMAAIFLFLIVSFRIVPINDSHSIMDQALSMARSGEKPMGTDGVYSTYFSKYSNNYLLALIFRSIYLALDRMGITDMYTPLLLLNMLCLLAGALLTWLIARKVYGLKAAVKTLLLFTLNPVYYLSVFWVYTNTLSVPFMMAVIYLGICLYSAKHTLSRCVYGVLFGVSTALGYLIRPTSVIPVIAFAVCFLCFLINRRASGTTRRAASPQDSPSNGALHMARNTSFQILQWAGIFAASLLAAGIVYLGANRLCDSYFHSVSDGNYPVTHWLMMGSHGDGLYQLDDDRFTLSFGTAEEKKQATLEKTKENYKELGALGTISLMVRKIVIAWSDQYYNLAMRMKQPMRYHPLYAWLVAENSDIFRLYCHSFWLTAVLLSINCCIRQLRRKRIPTVTFLLLLSLFGSILFYCFWEVKPAYSMPFLPLFFLLAQEGSNGLPDGWQKLPAPGNRPAVQWIRKICCLLAVLCLAYSISLFHSMTTEKIEHNNYSIHCDGKSWLKTLSLEDGGTMVQEFHPNAAFNEITLLATATDSEDGQNNCRYHISLADGTGNLVYEKMVGADDIPRSQALVLQMNPQPAAKGSGYRLIISNAGGTKGSISFRTRKGICLDTYDGQFTINGTLQGTDLYLRVCNRFWAPYCSKLTAFCICFGGCAIAILILSGALLPGFFRRRGQQGSGLPTR